MTAPRTIKIRIPAETVEVDVEAWALAYGIAPEKVREDVRAYFKTWCKEQVEALGLGPK